MALLLGCTVEELLNKISSYELTEWMAYFSVVPFEDDRADLRSGIISSTIANRHRVKGEKEYEPSNFMPKYNVKKRFIKKKPMTAKQGLDFFRALDKRLKAKDKNG